MGIAVAAVATIVNFVVSAYLARTGRMTGSTALHANAADLRTDAIVSLGVLVSLILIKSTGAGWIDPVVGLIVATAITITGIRILLGASRRLADESLPADELATLERVVRSFLGEEVVGYHDLRARHVGTHHQVDMHLQFAAGTTLDRAHYVSHQLQDAIVARLPETTVLVHLEPEHRIRRDRFGQLEPQTREPRPGKPRPSEPRPGKPQPGKPWPGEPRTGEPQAVSPGPVSRRLGHPEAAHHLTGRIEPRAGSISSAAPLPGATNHEAGVRPWSV